MSKPSAGPGSPSGGELPSKAPKPYVVRIFEALDAREISQNEMARRTGWAQSRFSAWRNGTGSPDLEETAVIGAILGFPLDWPLRGGDVPVPPDVSEGERLLLDVIKSNGWNLADVMALLLRHPPPFASPSLGLPEFVPGSAIGTPVRNRRRGRKPKTQADREKPEAD